MVPPSQLVLRTSQAESKSGGDGSKPPQYHLNVCQTLAPLAGETPSSPCWGVSASCAVVDGKYYDLGHASKGPEVCDMHHHASAGRALLDGGNAFLASSLHKCGL
jgi:hypothetical protein